MNKETIQRRLPIIAVVLTLCYFAYHAYPRASDPRGFNFHEFGMIPVIDGGRYKPIQSVAQNALMVITHRSSYYDSDTGKRYPATKWLLDAQTTPLPNADDLRELFPINADKKPSWSQKVFRIENDELLRFLDLKHREGLRYSLTEILGDGSKWQDFVKHAQEVRSKDPKTLSLFDGKVHELATHLQLFFGLSSHTSPLSIPNPDGSDQWSIFRTAHEEFGDKLDKLPATPDAKAYAALRQLFVAYDKGDEAKFNSTLASYLAELRAESPDSMRSVRVEVFFNDFAPFYRCLEIYAILAVIGALTWFPSQWSVSVQKACLAAMATTFVFHLFGLVVRMYLQDRMFVFVTNLYSSAVFIGLGCAIVCIIAELIFKNGIALVIGNTTGFCSLIIAHMLSMSGDTLEMMQAVLDTNFWLATHVTCITLGYTAAFVAGFMGIAYIMLGLFTEKLRGEGSANLTRMTYGVLCTGMFLSFVGTVLGGLWADYSWGRFWGWDPKENGALLIVIWISLILHARWGGMVKHRGIAVLSVLGIVVTSWSWFGTNFLGVGLHSYGFRQGAMASLMMIDLGFLAIAGMGLIPLNMWTSFRPANTAASLPSGAAPKPA